MKRPVGITISALILVWLALSGFGHAWIIVSRQSEDVPTIIGVVALVYSVTALISVVGLWMMKPWAIYATRIWMGVCFLFLIVFASLFNDLVLGSYVGAFGLLVFIFTLFLLFDRYIRSTVISTHNE